MTEDIPFDYKKYTKGMEEFYKIFLSVLDVDEDSQREFEKLDISKGFQVAGDIIVNMYGTEIEMKEQVLEVTEKAVERLLARGRASLEEYLGNFLEN